MLHYSTKPVEREQPRTIASRTGERHRHFEALLARSYAQMRARRQSA